MASAVHYITIRVLTRELAHVFVGSRVVGAFTQEKNELIVIMENSFGLDSSLIFSIEPRKNYVVWREGVSRAKKNSTDLFPSIVSLSIANIKLHHADRLLQFTLDNGQVLIAQLYDSAASNILLLDDKMTVVEAFKRNQSLAGQPFPLPDENEGGWSLLFEDRETIERIAREHPQEPVASVLRIAFPLFGKLYNQEVLFRTGLDGSVPTQELSSHHINTLWNEGKKVFELLDRPEPTIYFRDGTPHELAMISLNHLAHHDHRVFATANDAIKVLISNTYRRDSFEDEKKLLVNRIERERKRLERTREALIIQSKTDTHADEYERLGNLLLAQLQQVPKGANAVELDDIYSTEASRIRITLDPTKRPAQNAEHYFEKARKARDASKEARDRLPVIEGMQKRLDELAKDLEQVGESGSLKQFRTHYREELRVMNINSSGEGGQQKELPPFRIFSVAGGLQVWVGKSSENNDLLTTKYARPHDIWFHVRGASGSHTILRVERGKDNAPPKEAIKQAASIAAYYSKMRNAANVPVAYCERKYVRKPKGAHAGTVTLEREDIVFVTPRLPS